MMPIFHSIAAIKQTIVTSFSSPYKWAAHPDRYLARHQHRRIRTKLRTSCSSAAAGRRGNRPTDRPPDSRQQELRASEVNKSGKTTVGVGGL